MSHSGSSTSLNTTSTWSTTRRIRSANVTAARTPSGTPFCVTVDHQTLEDGTVTVRHRDTMQQERVAIDDLYRMVDDEVSYRKLFRKLNL